MLILVIIIILLLLLFFLLKMSWNRSRLLLTLSELIIEGVESFL